MVGTSIGASLGWVTRKLNKAGYNITARASLNSLTPKDVIVAKRFFLELGVNPKTLERLGINEDGELDWMKPDEEVGGGIDRDVGDEEDMDRTVEIEEYGVPPGSRVHTKHIISWMKTHDVINNIRDPKIRKTYENIMTRDLNQRWGASGKISKYGYTKEQRQRRQEADIETIYKRIAYLIQEKWFNEGYKSKRMVVSQDGTFVDSTDVFAPEYHLDEHGNFEYID